MLLILCYSKVALSQSQTADQVPDFIVYSVTGPATANPGETVTLFLQARNIGPDPSQAGSYVILRGILSSDQEINCDDPVYSDACQIPINNFSGGIIIGCPSFMQITIPVSISPGTYFWGGYIDPVFYWNETNNGNNALCGNSVQIGATAPLLNVTPSSASVSSGAGSTITSVYSNNNWTCVADQSWITVTPSSGYANLTTSVSINYSANTMYVPRYGTVTFNVIGIPPVIFSIQQAGLTNPYLSVNAQVNCNSITWNSNITWDAFITGGNGYPVTAKLQMTQPFDNQISVYQMTQDPLNSQHFSITRNMNQIGTYITKVIGEQNLSMPVYSNTMQIQVSPLPPVDDYPYSGSTSGADVWSFLIGQCTSYVAWKVNQSIGYDNIYFPVSDYPFRNNMTGNGFSGGCSNPVGRLSDACRWAKLLHDNLGIPVDQTPQPGSIAHWNNSGNMPFGHVAYVHSITNGNIVISEFNYSNPLSYGTRALTPGNPGYPDQFIHIEVGGYGGINAFIESLSSEGQSYKIFPNPTKGKVNILNPKSKIIHISLFDYTGREVLNTNCSQSTELDLTGNSKGLYFIKVELDQTTFSQKIILD